MQSAIYQGSVRHARLAEPRRAFAKRLFLLYLDLAELDRVFAGRWLWGVERARFASFRRADYLGDPRVPLDTAVRDLVAAQLGRRPSGPIRLLAHLRYAGYVFNPVSFYYCFDASGALDAVVADVSNTPWNERHAYVLPAAGGRVDARVAKRFHVSPFLPMEHEYRFSLEAPGERLHARIENSAHGVRQLDARLELVRREITGATLVRALLRFPFMTAQGIAAIYWQALRLRRLHAPEYPHPADAKRPEALA